MSFNPGVSWFTSFHDHIPSTNHHCIYFTKKGARCRCRRDKDENLDQANQLYDAINGLPVDDINIELIKKYVLLNCCKTRGVHHKDRMEDGGHLTPLAERWLDEIRRHARENAGCAVSVAVSDESSILPDATIIPATSTSRRNSTVELNVPSTPTRSVNTASSTPSMHPSPKASATDAELTLPSPYDLRPRDSALPKHPIPDQSISEFRPHIEEPRPSDSVSSRLLYDLRARELKTGSLYIFKRSSSPGHVKIGWTSGSVEGRLEKWSECGYNPILLFSVRQVPSAQRVETLTHYALLKEWRRERGCQGCGTSHKEWFEVSEERAKQVVGDWARFMKVVRPYDSKGALKAEWKDFVKKAVQNEEAVTAEKLLEHYELSLLESTELVKASKNSARAVKAEEEDKLENIPGFGNLQDNKGVTGEIRLFEDGASSNGPSITDASLPEVKEEAKKNMSINIKTLLKAENSPRAEPPAEDVLAERALVDKEPLQRQTQSPVTQPAHSQDTLYTQAEEPDLDPHSERKARKEGDEAVCVSGSETRDEKWDEEETLVEILAPESLEKVASRFDYGVGSDVSFEKADKLLKAVDGLRISESEVSAAVVIVQA